MSSRSLLASALVAAALVAAAAGRLSAQAPDTAPAPDATPRCDAGRHVASRVAVGTVFVGGNAALYEYFRRAWWSGERGDFFINNDWDGAFRDQDKAGHALGGYHLARIGSSLLRGACVGRRKAVWWGAAYAAAFQLQIEVWDGYQRRYGFSPPDLMFNTMGAGLAVAQEEVPALRHLKPTFSYARTGYVKHPERFPAGSPASELRPSVDYAGQTYWISADVNAMLPSSARPYWPDLVRLSVGHSVTDWLDPVTGGERRGRRELVLSLDLDVEKLPGDNAVWKQVKHQLSYLHLPAPALVLTPTVRGVAWYR